MSSSSAESDWKVLRSLQEPAQERFCKRTLKEIAELSGNANESFYERYQQIRKHLKECEEEMRLAFWDVKRSTAIIKINTLYSRQLLTEEEFNRFSAETRERVTKWCEVGENPFWEEPK